jgi:hypothetical protein
MLSIYEQENALFERWIEHEKWIYQDEWTGITEDIRLEDIFCQDGLHYTGKPEESHGESWRILDCDNMQETLWNNAFLKPVFLCKDYNSVTEDGELTCMDIREETGYKNDNLYFKFYSKYMILLYGLTNYDVAHNKFPAFEEAIIKENYWLGDNGFFHAPVVRMNLKKIAGGRKCPDWLLDKYIKQDKDLITQQRDIYKGANVFVCCHGGYNWNPIWDLLKEEGYGWFPDLKQYDKNDDSFWYSEKDRIAVICTPHMSARTSYWSFYKALPLFERFLSEFKGFID